MTEFKNKDGWKDLIAMGICAEDHTTDKDGGQS